MAARKLTQEQKENVRRYALEQEKRKHPSAERIDIIVDDEIDEVGQVHWRAHIITVNVAGSSIIGTGNKP